MRTGNGGTLEDMVRWLAYHIPQGQAPCGVPLLWPARFGRCGAPRAVPGTPTNSCGGDEAAPACVDDAPDGAADPLRARYRTKNVFFRSVCRGNIRKQVFERTPWWCHSGPADKFHLSCVIRDRSVSCVLGRQFIIICLDATEPCAQQAHDLIHWVGDVFLCLSEHQHLPAAGVIGSRLGLGGRQERGGARWRGPSPSAPAYHRPSYWGRAAQAHRG